MKSVDNFIETCKIEIGYEHMNECNRILAWFEILKLIKQEYGRSEMECKVNANTQN